MPHLRTFAAALTAATLLAPRTSPAQRPDTVVTDTSRRLPAVDVVARRTGEGLQNPLLLLTSASVAEEGRAAEMPARILPDALRDLPGVQVQQTNAGHGTVILRGLVGSQVLLLLDGIRLNNATVRDGPNQYLSLVDAARVARVEVVRGPGSVVFGSDAMGGVVNVLTRRPGVRAGGSASVAASGADRGVRGQVAAWGPVARGGQVRALGGFSAVSAGDAVAGGAVGRQRGTSFSSTSADARLEADLGSCGTVSLSVQGMDMHDVSRYDRLVTFRAPSPGADAEFRFEPQRHVLAGAAYSATGCAGAIRARGLTTGYQVQQEGRVQRSNRVNGVGATVPDSIRLVQRDDVRSLFATGFLEPASRRGTVIRVGGDVYHDRVSASGYQEVVSTGARAPTFRVSGADTIPAGRFPDGADAVNAGVWAHATRLVLPRLRVLGGVRSDVSRVRARAGDDFGGDADATNGALSGHLGLTLFTAAGRSLGLHAGTSFRAPNIYDFSTVTRVPGGVVLPSPDLRPERSATYEASAAVNRDDLRASAVAYLTRISGFIDRVPGTFRGDTLFQGRRVFRAANIGEARLGGFEVAGWARRDRLEFGGQAFWTRGTQSVSGTSEAMTRIPPLTGSVSARSSLGTSRTSWVELVARFAGDQRRLSSRDLRDSRIQPGGSTGWVTFGFRGGFELAGARVTAGFENVGDRLYREHGSGLDGPGRHAWLRIERRFGGPSAR